ncbi:MAG: prolyl oligopeptidase family serine peptidase, partial [Flavobacteriaceae bacterium]
SRLSYFALIQYLVNQGYAILAVNNRGSTGYGKEFNHMDDKNHGDKDLKDCIAGKDFFESTEVIDMDKVGIIGGSYGGYMVMAALAFEPEAFDMGVNIFGVTNWIRTLRSIPPYWESYKKALYDELGDPYSKDSLRLHEISPLFHTENVIKPLMVLQGANDVRVLQVESDEIVAGVKANGVPVEYVIFDDEGHGFRKKENEIEGYGKIKLFLDQYLKDDPAGEVIDNEKI